MLAGLGFDPLVGRHHQDDDADATETGQSVVQEAFVPGHVDEADLQITVFGARVFEVSEAEVDGDASGFLLGPAVTVDAGQGLEEAGLAVIDVASGADDDAFS